MHIVMTITVFIKHKNFVRCKCFFIYYQFITYLFIFQCSLFPYPRTNCTFFSIHNLIHRPIPLNHRNHSLPEYFHVHFHIPLTDILRIQLHNFFKISNLTSSANLPHTRNAWFDRKSRSVMEFIFIPLIQCRWTGSYDAHITSLCQLRNNFSVQKKNL